MSTLSVHLSPCQHLYLIGMKSSRIQHCHLWWILEVVSGSGRFLLWLAKQNPDSQNYLGLEIRAKLVKRAEFWVKELALSNVHFMFANAAVSFKQLVSTYPGPLALVSILCPDPHFKKRHHKRRVVQTPLVNSILTRLMPEGKYLDRFLYNLML
ncbi:hypothetical protein ERO13_D11G237000v2 [Gossypium hirsutum]|uniref:tRNA (guanine(46)-N(7))-methyltransferase n=1 Tax=Gossypium hirsutum TaxID=3635 RepID=A0ABM3AZA4_GOSHI|nr:tRNA (guanine-N(7)-)-methyltransferase isoform X5 [Gossypium hirsutum]KAG4121940.1 hypothetical protein ERO13_D11G237000v2 [Gossypium hirsutum]